MIGKRTLVALSSIAALVGGFALGLDEPAASPAAGPVVAIRVDSIIHPVALEYVLDGIEAAKEQGAQALVIELDTPGGLLTPRARSPRRSSAPTCRWSSASRRAARRPPRPGSSS